MFVPNFLVYFEPRKASVWDVDFSSMGFTKFVRFLEYLTKENCKDVDCWLNDKSLSSCIKILDNDADYNQFLEYTYVNGNMMNVYVDH